MLRTVCIGAALLGAAGMVNAGQLAAGEDRFRGVVNPNDGTFTIQGYLEDNGSPADGMYSFRVEVFDDAAGFDIVSDLLFFSDPIPVENGLFVLEVQMGGTGVDARGFWRELGAEEMWLEIGVSDSGGGPYTTLGDRMKVGWGARAQYAGTAGGLSFPIDEFYQDEQGDPLTLVSIENFFGGTILELTSGTNTNAPIIDIQGTQPYGVDFGLLNGAIRIDAMDEPVGVLSVANEYGLVGIIGEGAGPQIAAVFGQVEPGVAAGAAFTGFHSVSNNLVDLATMEYAGAFSGDVVVTGELERDFGSNDFAPAGPVAYGFVNADGTSGTATANMNVTWNSSLEQYEITIDGETLGFSTHAAVVTVVDTIEPRVATTNVVSGQLVVKIWDLNSGNIAVQDNFQIAVFNAAPGAALLNAPPEGVDPEVYYGATGQVPVIREAPKRARPVRDRPGGFGG